MAQQPPPPQRDARSSSLLAAVSSELQPSLPRLPAALAAVDDALLQGRAEPGALRAAADGRRFRAAARRVLVTDQCLRVLGEASGNLRAAQREYEASE